MNDYKFNYTTASHWITAAKALADELQQKSQGNKLSTRFGGEENSIPENKLKGTNRIVERLFPVYIHLIIPSLLFLSK